MSPDVGRIQKGQMSVSAVSAFRNVMIVEHVSIDVCYEHCLTFLNFVQPRFSSRLNILVTVTMSEMSDFEEIPVTAAGDRPVQIVKIDDESEEHNFILDEDALNDILNKDNIKDKPVCIISVAGAFRKGKSFLLNFMLRYLENGASGKWIDPESERDLVGFHWR